MRLLFTLLPLFIFQLSYGQSLKFEKSKKRNQIGMDISIGISGVYKKKSKLGFSGAINYTRVSESGKWNYEFGIQYTQLNYTTDKEFSSYIPLSDTFRIRTGNILFFDTPVNFQRVFPMSEKMDLIINYGCFFTTYIKWFERSDKYLTADESFIQQNKRIIKPFNYFKMGLDFGLGIKRYISKSELLYLSAHLNSRFELDPVDGVTYFFPNIALGYRLSL